MLQPGATIGILGGGQLGRMLALAAARLGLRCHIFAPEADSPAFQVATERTCAPYENADALRAFARSVAAVTYEFENVPLEAIAAVEPHAPVRPGPRAIEISRDRLIEKRHFSSLGMATAAFRAVDTQADLDAAAEALGLPLILKTRRFGYDGKGQVRIDTPAALAGALTALGGAPAIAEAVVPFALESSIIAVRAADGSFAAYEPGLNEHRGGILRRTMVPAPIPPGAAAAMLDAARRLSESLDYVGVIGVEFFVLPGGAGVVANEFAPRVHNSGHWTMDGAATSQFEQHVRALAGWPLGSCERLAPTEMVNLIGEEVLDWPRHLAEADASLHLYGKGEVRPGRKMGHVNRRRAPAGG